MTRKRSKFRKNETHETIEQSTVQIEGQEDLLQQGWLTFFLICTVYIVFFCVIYAAKQVLWTCLKSISWTKLIIFYYTIYFYEVS